MAVVSSLVIEDMVQVDGRRWVRERHMLTGGGTRDVVYMAEVGANAQLALAANAIVLADQLTQEEIAANANEVDNAGI